MTVKSFSPLPDSLPPATELIVAPLLIVLLFVSAAAEAPAEDEVAAKEEECSSGELGTTGSTSVTLTLSLREDS